MNNTLKKQNNHVPSQEDGLYYIRYSFAWTKGTKTHPPTVCQTELLAVILYHFIHAITKYIFHIIKSPASADFTKTATTN